MNKKDKELRITEIKQRLNDINNELVDINDDNNMTIYDNFDDYLDDLFSGCFTFTASEVLKTMDSTAYEREFQTYRDVIIENLEQEKEELEKELEELKGGNK